MFATTAKVNSTSSGLKLRTCLDTGQSATKYTKTIAASRRLYKIRRRSQYFRASLASSRSVEGSIKLTIYDVQGPFFDGERGFLDRFTQRWMRVTGAAEIFGAAAKFDHGDGFGD